MRWRLSQWCRLCPQWSPKCADGIVSRLGAFTGELGDLPLRPEALWITHRKNSTRSRLRAVSKLLVIRSWDGVFPGYRGWRSVAIYCAGKGLHLQVGTAQYSIRVSLSGTGKLKTSLGDDKWFVGAGVLDCAETRAIVGRQSTGRLKFEMGTMNISGWAMMSARCFQGLPGAQRTQSNYRDQNRQMFHLQSPRGEHNLICRGGCSYCQSVGLLPPRLCGYFRAEGPRGQHCDGVL